MNQFSIISKNEEETGTIAQLIAPNVDLGDVIILDGNLGTGKTHFVKAFAGKLGSPNPVTSPTFTIANFYTLNQGNLLHIDTYRLSGISEFRDLGLEDYFSQSIMLIEWGTKVITEFDDYLLISFEFVDLNTRKITLSYVGEQWAAKFNSLVQKLITL
ncbi:tRNA (adenosine(37)-N6)-threonylcarbamoyltransferase complex ATPase subunit type 1 TsaE [Runella sp.]|uniref:tRNA (adenosine(37)-N6)-threonylcarbamoyltransferase complex ATPase subunit type 1 TsaE n=1 Tax=Runella sp. TaxID=1960881 RepID=UPI003D1116DB